MPYTVAVDASALLPRRSLTHVALMHLAADQLFLPRWSLAVMDDLRALYRETYPAAGSEFVEGFIADLGTFEDAMIQPTSLMFVEPVSLDVGPRAIHAVEAAQLWRADAILTTRPELYPVELMRELGLVVQGLDDFLCSQLELRPIQLASTFDEWASQNQRRMAQPPSVAKILDVMEATVPLFVEKARAHFGPRVSRTS